jgi:hypothetical protein
MFIELCFSIMPLFHIYFSYGQLLFLCLTSSLSFAILSQAGLFEIPATYLGFLSYFLARGPVLLNGCSSEKLMLMGVQSVHLLSLTPYPKHVQFTSLTRSQLSTGGPNGTCP